VTLKPGLGSIRVIGADTDRSATYHVSINVPSQPIKGLYRTVS